MIIIGMHSGPDFSWAAKGIHSPVSDDPRPEPVKIPPFAKTYPEVP